MPSKKRGGDDIYNRPPYREDSSILEVITSPQHKKWVREDNGRWGTALNLLQLEAWFVVDTGRVFLRLSTLIHPGGGRLFSKLIPKGDGADDGRTKTGKERT